MATTPKSSKPAVAKKAKAARVPLAEQTPAKQKEWMQRQLATIDGAALVADMAVDRKDAVAACRKQLASLVATLKKEFPATLWNTPSGQEWKGTAIPLHMTKVEHPKKDKWLVFGSLLHIAAQLNGSNEKLIRWMLASGCDANLYAHGAGSTPLGFMAYACKPKCVRACREAGLDMTLLLRADQMADGKPKNKDIVNSTLLHRFVDRFHHFGNEDAAAEVLQELLLAGLDPLAKAASGRTPRDMAHGRASDIVEAWIATQTANQLQSDTMVVEHPGRTLRL